MFIKTSLTEIIRIENIITIHCFDYSRNFQFTGESHDFWEMVFVDAGEVGVLADSTCYILRSGDAIFHKPGEYHNIWANNTFASVIVLTFETLSASMQYFCGKKLCLNNAQKRYIAEILREAVHAFEEPLDIVDQIKLIKKPDAPFGAEQMIKTHMEQLFIDIIRAQTSREKLPSTLKNYSNESDEIVSHVIEILEDNICSRIQLDEICAKVNFSKSYVKSQFKNAMGCGIYQMYIKMKIAFSKKLLSEEKYSITEISEILGFNSVHHFSRTFKKSTNMSPSDYIKSVRKRALL